MSLCTTAACVVGMVVGALWTLVGLGLSFALLRAEQYDNKIKPGDVTWLVHRCNFILLLAPFSYTITPFGDMSNNAPFIIASAFANITGTAALYELSSISYVVIDGTNKQVGLTTNPKIKMGMSHFWIPLVLLIVVVTVITTITDNRKLVALVHFSFSTICLALAVIFNYYGFKMQRRLGFGGAKVNRRDSGLTMSQEQKLKEQMTKFRRMRIGSSTLGIVWALLLLWTGLSTLSTDVGYAKDWNDNNDFNVFVFLPLLMLIFTISAYYGWRPLSPPRTDSDGRVGSVKLKELEFVSVSRVADATTPGAEEEERAVKDEEDVQEKEEPAFQSDV